MASAISQHADLLSRVEIFASLDRVSLAKLAARLQHRPLVDGAILCRQGDPGDGLFLITHGKIAIIVSSSNASPGGSAVRLGSRSSGEVLGEMALLTGEGRSATLQAEGDAEVLFLDRDSFLEVVGQEPSVGLSIAALLSRRLTAANAARVSPANVTERDQRAEEITTSGSVPSTFGSERFAQQRVANTGWRLIISVAVSATLLVAGFLIPPPAGLTAASWLAQVPILALIPLMISGSVPEISLALILAAAWVFGGVRTDVALSGFATSEWVLIVGAGLIGAAITSTGLLYRLVLWGAHHSPRTYLGQLTALALAGLLSSAAVPSATSRVLLIAPLSTDLAETLGYRPGSRAAAGLGLTVLLGFGLTAGPFLTSSGTALLVFAVLPASAHLGLDWVSWAIRALPMYLITLLIAVAYVSWRFAPRLSTPTELTPRRGNVDVVRLQRAILGPPTFSERLVGIVTVVALLGFATQSLHHVDPAWVAVAAVVVLSVGGVLTNQTVRSIDWNFVMFYGILASVTGVFAATHVDTWITATASNTLGGHAIAPVVFIAVLAVVSFGVSLVIRYTAAAPLLTIAFVPVALQLGINPWIVGIVALVATNAFILPHQSAQYQLLYSATTGRMFTHREARSVAIVHGLTSFAALLASIPYWHILGLL